MNRVLPEWRAPRAACMDAQGWLADASAFACLIEQMDGVFILFQAFGRHALQERRKPLRQLK
ncbi:MAG: hypothetical protein V8Q21_05035 [Akkermansia muciniphila]